MLGGKRLRSGSKQLPVYICEYHDEALRCLHHGIRRRRIPFDQLTMVHLDAHPDMSASVSIPADTVFDDPAQLYFGLRTDSGGIASWILPAIYGGHFHGVWWVRPSWALQIADGRYDVAVGKAKPSGRLLSTAPADASKGQDSPEETIHISCPAPYFVEDDIYCKEADLVNAKPLRLFVSELPGRQGMRDEQGQARAVADYCAEARPQARGAWTLDVCLDFFACGNPFLKHVRTHIASAFAAVMNAASFRRGPVSDVSVFLTAREEFVRAYGRVLTEDGKSREDAIDALGSLLPQESRATLLADLRAAAGEARDTELQEIIEAADMVTLPLHAVKMAEVQESLVEFETFLQHLCGEDAFGGKPSAVTIARSVVDGFCPMRWLCMLESSVLDALRRQLGDVDVVYSDELDALENP